MAGFQVAESRTGAKVGTDTRTSIVQMPAEDFTQMCYEATRVSSELLTENRGQREAPSLCDIKNLTQKLQGELPGRQRRLMPLMGCSGKGDNSMETISFLPTLPFENQSLQQEWQQRSGNHLKGKIKGLKNNFR